MIHPTLYMFLEAQAVPQQQLAVSQTACVLFATPLEPCGC